MAEDDVRFVDDDDFVFVRDEDIEPISAEVVQGRTINSLRLGMRL